MAAKRKRTRDEIIWSKTMAAIATRRPMRPKPHITCVANVSFPLAA
jgi:hypothetical protein